MRWPVLLAALLLPLTAEAGLIRSGTGTTVRQNGQSPVLDRYVFAPSGATVTTSVRGTPLTVTGPATPVCASGQCWTAAAGTLAIGEYGALVYGSRTSRILNNQRSSANTATGGMLSSSWTKRGTASVAAGCVVAPDGSCTADEITVGGFGVNDIQSSASGFAYNTPIATTFWLQRVSTTGTLRSEQWSWGSAQAIKDTNLATIGDGWQLVTLSAGVSSSNGFAGLIFSNPAGTPLTVRIWRPWQVEGAIPGPDAEVGASPLSVAAHVQYSDISAASNTEGCVYVEMRWAGPMCATIPRILATGDWESPLYVDGAAGTAAFRSAYYDGTNNFTSGPIFAGLRWRVITSWSGSSMTIKNVGSGLSASGPYDGSIFFANKRLWFGSDASGAKNACGAYKTVVVGRTANSCDGQATPNETVTCIGDSITAGMYPTYLQSLVGDTYVVTNAGIGGNTTSQMVTRWHDTIRATHPQQVVVLGGVNDLAFDVPVATIYANLLTIVSEAKADGARVTWMTVTPWKNSSPWTSERQATTEQLNALIRANGAAEVVDAYAVMGSSADPTVLNAAYDSGDHIHPNATGYNALAVGVRPTVDR